MVGNAKSRRDWVPRRDRLRIFRGFSPPSPAGFCPVILRQRSTETHTTRFGYPRHPVKPEKHCTMVAKYRIQIRELTPADVNTACDVQFAAFENNVMNDLMYPGGLNDAAKTKSRERLLAALTGEVDKKKGKAFIYVAEYWPADSPADAPGEIVAMARWALHAEPRTEEEYKGEEFNPTAEMFGDGANLEFIKVFVGGLNGKTSEHIKGEPYLRKSLLVLQCSRYYRYADLVLMHTQISISSPAGRTGRG